MNRVLLLQLPIPRLNFGLKTGNIPLGAAYLKQAAADIADTEVEILPESVVSYLGDRALVDLILSRRPHILGFTVFAWNVERSLYLAEQIKQAADIKIVFGGPEVTPDNDRVNVPFVDFHVYGEGETVFRELLQNKEYWHLKKASAPSGHLFQSSPSPYLSGLLEPGIENMMMLETQRGCPYKCGFCYYNKSRKSLVFADEARLLEGIRWAVENRIDELYLLDPSLNARPGLKDLLREIAVINKDQAVSINSEIRAEWIDEESADLFAAAGFTTFEIGLQSTNPEALKQMRRPTDLNRFLSGTRRLKERGIVPRIDLIIGLPGDDLEGFNRSIAFVKEHDLYDDVQVFPLSVLPGTDFRSRSHELGLHYEPTPPYTVIETPTFSREDMILALDYAESLFDVSLYAFPDQNLSWKQEKEGDVYATLEDGHFISKLLVDKKRPLYEIEAAAKKMTHPYQVFVNPQVKDEGYIANILEILTIHNPFTPLELVFIEPDTLPDTRALLSAIKLKRPHFLDNDLRYLFSEPGNRAVLFTVVTENSQLRFNGDMNRIVYRWRKTKLPDLSDLELLPEMDGLLIDNGGPEDEIGEWQNAFWENADEMMLVSFAHIGLQKRWKELTASDEYRTGV